MPPDDGFLCINSDAYNGFLPSVVVDGGSDGNFMSCG